MEARPRRGRAPRRRVLRPGRGDRAPRRRRGRGPRAVPDGRRGLDVGRRAGPRPHPRAGAEAAAELLGCRPPRCSPIQTVASAAARRAAADIEQAIEATAPDGLLVFAVEGGVTGHPDHEAASRAAIAVAAGRGLPCWSGACRAGRGGAARRVRRRVHRPRDGGLPIVVDVDRNRQIAAAHLHVSQAVPGSVLWRRLELLGDASTCGSQSRPVPDFTEASHSRRGSFTPRR